MAIVFGNEMGDAMAKQAANEAALRGAAAEQVAWVDALAWQVQRRTIEGNLQASKSQSHCFGSSGKKVSGGFSTKLSCRRFSNKQHTNWHFGGQGSGGNVKSLSTAWVKRLLFAGWLENCASPAFSGPMSRCYLVLELCGMDFSISVQIEYAMFGRDQGVGAGRIEQDQAGIPASGEDELAVTSDGI